jgi:hypothetical protein
MLNTSSKRRPASATAHRCSLVCIRSTRAHASVESMGHATPVFTSVSPSPFSRAAILLGPFPKWPAFPASQYYGPLAPSRPDRQAMRPPGPMRRWRRRSAGRAGTVPTFIREPFDGIGTQLWPCTIATTTPQISPWPPRPATSPSRGVLRRSLGIIGCAVRSDPCPPGFGSVVQS